MMVRTQISLDSNLHRRARLRAAAEGVSLSELARRAIARELGRAEEPHADVSEIFSIGDSGGSDVAKHKDRYIAEGTQREYERKMGRGS